MSAPSHASMRYALENHCTFVEERPHAFEEHFKAAIGHFLQLAPHGRTVLNLHVDGASPDDVDSWASGTLPPYPVAKHAAEVMRQHVTKTK